MDVVFGLFVLMVVATLYFTPAIVAHNREVSSRWSVTVINALLGWTLIGWAIALAMAVSGAPVKNAPTTASSFVPASSPAADLSGTKECPDCAERVQATARVCRFCRHDFTADTA